MFGNVILPSFAWAYLCACVVRSRYIQHWSLYQAGDTRIPLPHESLWTPQKIVDCKVGLCTSLRTVSEFLSQ